MTAGAPVAGLPPAFAVAWDRLAALGWRPERIERVTRTALGERNRVFTVVHAGETVVVRLPRERLKEPGWYAREMHNLAAAAATGVTPVPLLADPADGLLVLPYVQGDHLKPRRVGPEAAVRIGRTLRRLHRETAPFRPGADILGRVLRRMSRVSAQPAAARCHAAGLPAVVRAMEPVAAILERTTPPPAPCHGDLVLGNMIDDGTAVHLIDWETSTAGDPHHDVANVCLRARLDGAAREAFLAAWLANADAATAEWSQARVALWEPVCALDKALTYWRNGVRAGTVDHRVAGWTRRCSEILAAPGTRAALLVLGGAGPIGP